MSRAEDVPHNRLTFDATEVEAIRRVVESGWWASGPRVADLEAALVQTSGARDAVAVGSGLAALRLALKGLGVGRGDTVVVPAYSCVALPNAVLSLGATPVPIDVDRGEWNLSIAACGRHFAAVRPRAVIAVHTFGTPAPIHQLMTRMPRLLGQSPMARVGLPDYRPCHFECQRKQLRASSPTLR